jgi:arylsulfatase A-like enzyme/Flp pilus assembly protein TadD
VSVASLAALSLAGRGTGPEAPSPSDPPNLLLISIDTLRADRIGAYGGKVETKTLDRLAAQGVLFERAVSQVPVTLPSHASLFTGAYPTLHGVHDNGSYRLESRNQTLAETLRGHGYRTGAFIGSFALDSRFGLDQGFEVYDDYYGDARGPEGFGISERRASSVLAPALSWIEEASPQRWFAFVHLYDPHAPYQAPSPFRERYAREPYSAEVAYVDQALGEFLSRLREAGALVNTLIVVTADHGEGLGEHGEKTHGMFAYDSTLHVPLVFSWEGRLPRGRRVGARVRLIDVAPTVLDLVGLGRPPVSEQAGESLAALARGEEEGKDRESYFEALAFHLNRNWAPLTGIYRGKLKYIRLPIPELYDLSADPGESRNLFEPGLAQVQPLAAALEEIAPSDLTGLEPGSVDEETAARLRSLGYVSSPSPSRERREYTMDDDPKRLVGLSDKLDAGVAAQLAGRPHEAARLFREIIAERPSFSNAHANLAEVLAADGKIDEAIAVLESALARGARTPTMLARLGFYLQEGNRVEESVRVLKAAIDENPSHAEAYNYLGIALARLGRHREALEAFGKLIELDASYASAYSNAGSVHLAMKDFGTAERDFRKALSMDPNLARAWNGLGVALASTGRHSDAVDAWRRSIEIDASQPDTLYNLGTLLTKLDRFEEAIVYLEGFVAHAPAESEEVSKVRRLIQALEAHRRRS